MLKPLTQISKLIVNSSRSKTTCHAFISKVSPEEERSLGNIFGIIEIDYQDKDNNKIIETIIKEMQNAYYGTFGQNQLLNNANENTTQLYLDGIENIETIFEKSLQKINKQLTYLIKEEGLNLVPEKINAIIGVIKDKHLYFTNIGNMNAFLIHKKKNEDYTMVNILENAQSEERLNLIRIFANITSGRINPEDSLLFCNPILLDYFSLEKLKSAFTTLTIPSALQQLKNLLTEASPNANVAAIIIKLTNEKEISPSQVSNLTSQTSIDNLLGTEEKTKEFLSPSLLLNIKRNVIKSAAVLNAQGKIVIQKIKEKNEEFKIKQKEERQKKSEERKILKQQKAEQKALADEQMRQEKAKLEEERAKQQTAYAKQEPEIKKIVVKKNYAQIIKNKLKLLSKKISNNFYKIVYILKGSFYIIYDKIKLTAQKTITRERIKTFSPTHIIDSEKIKTKAKKLCEKIKRIIYYLKYKFKNLPGTSQILFITTIILGLLFISSIVGLSIKQKSEKTVIAYNAQIEEIESKKNAAEASIIYNEEDKGKELLLEAKNLINELSEKSKKQRDDKETFLSEINILLEKLRHAENIVEPIVLADFKETDPTIQIFKIINKNNGLYTFNPFNNIIYRLNLGEQNTIDILKENSTSLGHLNLAIDKNVNNILFYHSNNGLAELNIRDNSLKNLDIALNNTNAQIKELYLYSNKLYLLDIDSQQIYRHTASLSGYTRGASWIQDETVNKDDMVSFAIDGAIYVLKNNGEIIKFTSGYKQKFEPTTPDPVWNNPTKIWTSNKTDYIYVLDPGEKRLVVFDKKGKLIVQYYSDKFNNLKDFAVNEQEKKIYLLDDTIVYGILASHLK